MLYSIDRFEGEFAIIESLEEDYKILEIPIVNIPQGAKEGSVLCVDSAGVFSLDPIAQKEREDYIQSLMDELFE